MRVLLFEGEDTFNILFPAAVVLSSFSNLCFVHSLRVGLVESEIQLLVGTLER